jgi:uncharacterized protein YcaQ
MTGGQVRRSQLAAQGFARSRPTGRIDRRHLRRVFDDVGIVQIDSVSVLVRSHYLPFFSRLGPYDRRVLDDMAGTDHEIVEYWFHMASWAPTSTWPQFAWRMRATTNRWRTFLEQVASGDDLDRTRAEVTRRSPVTANELETRARPKEPWWDWSRSKQALEYLFHHGEVTARRRSNFEREYVTLTEVMPEALVGQRDAVSDVDAERWCLLEAAKRLGVGTAGDLADYPRMKIGVARRHLRDLAAEGVLEEVAVDGWTQPAYRHPEARVPRTTDARALLSPFDSLVWDRDRTERVFDFRYRIEIYVPRPKRVHGYYVLPFLLGDSLVARVDLKADRANRRLLVPASHHEPNVDIGHVADELAAELRELAAWLDLDDIHVQPRGRLSGALTTAVH